jgi:hypothetical protein
VTETEEDFQNGHQIKKRANSLRHHLLENDDFE